MITSTTASATADAVGMMNVGRCLAFVVPLHVGLYRSMFCLIIMLKSASSTVRITAHGSHATGHVVEDLSLFPDQSLELSVLLDRSTMGLPIKVIFAAACSIRP